MLFCLGNLNFLAHKKQSNKLRKVKVVQIEASPDSDDVSSLDSNTESLNSEDVFAGMAESKTENEQDTQDGIYFCCIYSFDGNFDRFTHCCNPYVLNHLDITFEVNRVIYFVVFNRLEWLKIVFENVQICIQMRTFMT